MAGYEDGDMPVPGRVTGAAGVQVGSRNLQVNNFFYGDPARASAGGTPSAPTPGMARFSPPGHAFISYVREDSDEVDALQRALEAAGVPVWRDTASLWPGEDWRARIREAITRDALVFIACFSSRSAARQKSYQNEELLLAIGQLRVRSPSDPWLIPVRFDDCVIPDYELGADRTLASIQWADLFGVRRDVATGRLVAAAQRLLRQPVALGGTAEADDSGGQAEAVDPAMTGSHAHSAVDSDQAPAIRPDSPGQRGPGAPLPKYWVRGDAADPVTDSGEYPAAQLTLREGTVTDTRQAAMTESAAANAAEVDAEDGTFSADGVATGTQVPSPAPASRKAARRRILEARRRLLWMLLGLEGAGGVLAATGLAALWVVVPPSVMLTGYLLLLREAAQADADRSYHPSAGFSWSLNATVEDPSEHLLSQDFMAGHE